MNAWLKAITCLVIKSDNCWGKKRRQDAMKKINNNSRCFYDVKITRMWNVLFPSSQNGRQHMTERSMLCRI